MNQLKNLLFFIIVTLHIAFSVTRAQKPELVYQIGHTDMIVSVAVSPDGKLVVSGSNNNIIKLWELESGLLMRTFIDSLNILEPGLLHVRFSPDGKYVLSATYSSIRLWDTITGMLIKKYEAPQTTSIAFSPDGNSFITGSKNGTIKLWNVHSGEILRIFEKDKSVKGIIHPGGVSCVAYASNGDFLLAGGYDGLVTVWEVNTGKLLRRYVLQIGPISALSISPNNTHGVISGSDCSFLVLDLFSGQNKRNKIDPLDFPFVITEVQYSLNGEYFLVVKSGSSYKTGFIEVRKSNDTKLIKTFKIKQNKSNINLRNFTGTYFCDIYSSFFTPDNKYILTGGNKLLLWKISNGEIVCHFKSNHSNVNKIIMTPAGFLFVTQDSFLKTFAFSEKKINKINSDSSLISSVSVSPDGSSVLIGNHDGSIYLWDLNHKNLLHSFENQNKTILMTAFSLDGNFGYTVTDSLLKIWDFKNYLIKDKIQMYFKRPKFSTVSSFKSQIYSQNAKIAFNPHFNLILSDSIVTCIDEDEFAFYRYKNSYNPSNILLTKKESDTVNPSNNLQTKIEFDDVSKIQKIFLLKTELRKFNISIKFDDVSKSQKTFLLKAGLKLLNSSTGKLIKTFNKWHFDAITAVEFSPDGALAVTGSIDMTIKLWDVHKGKEIKTLKGHNAEITDLKFSPQGHSILSASGPDDRTIKLWNVSDGKLIKTFSGHQSGINSISFSSDGRYFVSAGMDNTVKLWDVKSGNELATFFFFEDNEWIIMTPDGRFDGTFEKLKSLYYVQGLDIIPVDAFFEKFYTPGLLSEVFSGETLLDVPAFNFANQIKLPPLVEILSPQSDQKYTTNNVNISIRVTDQGGGINEIRLYQNGKLVQKTPKGFNPSVQTGENFVRDFEIDLVSGPNKFRVTAFNSDRVEAVPANISVDFKAPIPQGDLYIFAIGITEYKNNSFNLKFAKPDVMQFISLFENQKNLIFKNIFITDIYDQMAVREKIVKTMDELSAKIKPEDAFVLFFAGYGVMSSPQMSQPSQYYFALHDVSSLTDRGTPEKAGISILELNEYFRNIKAQKQVLVVDACHLTGNANHFALGRMTPEKALIQLARDTGVRLLAFNGNTQQIAEFDELGHSIFSQAFTTGFGGEADAAAGDGTITVKELALYLNDIIPELSQKHRGIMQYPNSWIGNEDFSLGIVNK